MKTSIQTAALVGAVCLAITATATAEPLGVPGQIAIAGDFSISIQSIDDGGEGDSQTVIQIAPALDYFIAPNLSLGGGIVFRDNEAVQQIGVGPRVGYVIGLGKISIWPKVGLAFNNASFEGFDNDVQSLTLTLFAPLQFHPVDHFFIGIGPALDLDLYVSDDLEKGTAFGLVSTVGGYF